MNFKSAEGRRRSQKCERPRPHGRGSGLQK